MASQQKDVAATKVRSESEGSSAPSTVTEKSIQNNGGSVAAAPVVTVQPGEQRRSSSLRNGEVQESTLETAQDVERNGLSWPVTACYMIAYNISAGIMTLARVFATMGLLSGLLLVESTGLMGGYTAYTQWRAIMRYPSVNTYPDVLALLLGKPGRWLGHLNMNLIYLFIAAIHILLSVQMWNNITDSAMCSVAFSALSTFCGFSVTMFRTLKEGSVLAIGAVISILGATLVTMIGVGLYGPAEPVHHLFIPGDQASLWKISAGISSIVFSFTGHIAYPQFIAGMQQPRDFPKALLLNQVSMMMVYTIVASVLYWYGGEKILSPALDSAPSTHRKVAWGLACFTITIAATIPMNLLAHNLDSGILVCLKRMKRQRSTTDSGKTELVPWKRWVPIVAGLWIAAWLIAEGIPVFANLVALVGALLGCWITLGFGALFWFRVEPEGPQMPLELRDAVPRTEVGRPLRCDCWGDDADATVRNGDGGFLTGLRFFCHQAMANTRRLPWMAVLNVFIVVVCIVVCVVSTAGSVADIMSGEDRRRPFACASGS